METATFLRLYASGCDRFASGAKNHLAVPEDPQFRRVFLVSGLFLYYFFLELG